MWGNKSYYVFNACSYTHMDCNPTSFVQHNADCDVNPNYVSDPHRYAHSDRNKHPDVHRYSYLNPRATMGDART